MHIYAAKSRCTFQNSTRNPSFLEETRPHQSFKKPYKKKKRKKERKEKEEKSHSVKNIHQLFQV